jgi:hypothetical protein
VAKGSGDAYWEAGRREEGTGNPLTLQEKGARIIEDSPHRPPKGGDRANILQGRGAKALEGNVPEVAPASHRQDPGPCWCGAVPGAAGEGMGRCGSPPPGPGTEGLRSRGKTLSPPRHEGKWSPSIPGLDGLPSPREPRGAGPGKQDRGCGLPSASSSKGWWEG